MNEFMTTDILATFAGLALAVGVIVQFTKSLIKKRFDDYVVRVYAFVIALVLTFIFTSRGMGWEGVALTTLNAILVTVAAMGGYEIISDPKARE